MDSIAMGIILVLAASIIASLLILEKRLDHRLGLFSTLLFGSVVVFYIRTGFGRYFTTIDESYYVSLLGDPHWYLSSIVSGYVTPFSLHIFRPFFATPVDEVVWYSIAMVLVYTLVLFFSYRRLGLSPKHSMSAVFILFMSPLYIWSMIQVRPQQVGLLVGFLLAVSLLRGIRKKAEILLVLILYLLLVFSHVLSFIVYSVLLVLYISVRVLVFDDGKAIVTYRFFAFTIALSWVAFLIFPYSGAILKNMAWLFSSVTGLKLSASGFSVLSVVFLLVGLPLWYLVLLRFRGRLPLLMQLFQRILARFSEGIEKRSPLLSIVILAGLLGILYVQFHLGSSLYNWVYRGSLLVLLLFQAGNIAFAIFYLRGILTALRRASLDTFELLSLMMLPLALLFLVLSFFMPHGNSIWGFHNWLIRALQYFVPLAAPIVAGVVRSEVDLVGKSSRLFVPLLIGLLITLSILNTARVPEVYNYDAVWSEELVSLCQERGTYAPRLDGSVYSRFVEDNLLRACGGTLELNLEPNNDFSMVSDSFYRYWDKMGFLSIDGFARAFLRKGEPPVLLAGGRVQFNSYITALFPGSSLISLSPDGKCPIESIVPGKGVILIGGPAVNPCIRELEKIEAFKVHVTANSLITPHSVYHVPIPNPWWDSKEGLFVIQTLEYMGRSVVAIEGTNGDSTLAGVHYFLEEVLPSPEKYVNISYVVGRWEETDGKVLDVVRGSMEDSNGFSPGDKIVILETGK